MPLVKHTFYIQIGRHSFTEAWYRGNGSTNLQAEMPVAKALAEKRARLLGVPCSIYAIRISNIDNPKVQAYTEYVAFNNDGTFGAAASNVALNMEFRNGDGTQEKLVQLRGIKDDFEVFGGQEGTAFDADYNQRLQEYGGAIVSLQYGWRASTSISKSALAYSTLLSGQVKFLFPANFFTLDQVGKTLAVTISKCVSSKNLNGPLTALVNAQNEAVSIKPITVWPQEAGDTTMMQRNVRNFVQAVGGRVQRLGKRQAGQPSLQSRGRGRVRIRG